jgi:hypothetical protein
VTQTMHPWIQMGYLKAEYGPSCCSIM